MVENNTKSYGNGRIYCIRNSVSDDIYVGSTTQPLSKRMQKHRSSMTSERDGNMLIYQKMREIGKRHFYIELYEEYPCENIEQLRKREGEIIRELKPSLNKRIEDRTIQEWKQDNKHKMQEYHRQYHIDHNEERKEYCKNWWEENKDDINEKRREDYQNNKEYHKQKREETKESRKFKIECPCGSVVRKTDISRHKKSMKHKNYEQSLQED